MSAWSLVLMIVVLFFPLFFSLFWLFLILFLLFLLFSFFLQLFKLFLLPIYIKAVVAVVVVVVVVLVLVLVLVLVVVVVVAAVVVVVSCCGLVVVGWQCRSYFGRWPLPVFFLLRCHGFLFTPFAGLLCRSVDAFKASWGFWKPFLYCVGVVAYTISVDAQVVGRKMATCFPVD